MRRWSCIVLVMAGLAPPCGLAADEVRYFEKDGVTYRETRRVVQRPMVETRLEQREQTVLVERHETAYQEQVRWVQRPVVEYRWEPYIRNRWNPFAQPTVEYRWVPHTRWESRQETLRVPVVNRQLVPEKRMQTVAVPVQRMVEEEMITRVAVGTRPAGGTDPFATGTAAVATQRSAPSGAASAKTPPRYSQPTTLR